jgi:toxin ParE1/3/4
MPAEVIWSPQARDDLLKIYLLIGREQPSSAERYFARIEEKVEHLRSDPRMGPRKREIRRDARMLVEAPYLILYCTHPDTDEGPVDAIEVVRIVDGRRKLSAIFR